MGRPKKATRELQSIQDCELAMWDLLAATTDLETLVAERDIAVASASAQFEPNLDNARGRRDEALADLQAYYYGHLAEIEQGGAKHLQLANGVIGRRDHPAAWKPLNRRWTWKAIAAAVRAKFGPARFFRQPEPELDKDALKAADLPAEELKQLGLKLEADETFYAEPARLPAGGGE